MKTIVVCAIAGLVLLAAAAAWAQPEPQTVYQTKTFIKFTEITIAGEVRKPDVTVIFSRTPPEFDKKIELKAGFLAEILASVEKL